MTTAIDSVELTRVGPGTVMGQLMREYWIPALISSELARDSAPLRLMLLGEKLIAFRDSEGRVGIMDHRCPHRCASLFLGRNENGGIRCIYHGWKFDVSGKCLEMPNVAPAQDFRHKVSAKAYPVVERAGMVWVYMGPRTNAPALPAFEILDVPEDEVGVSLIQRNCNYLQALEGDVDTSHFGFLHAGHVDPDDLSEDDPIHHTVAIRAPRYHVADAAWGTTYAGYRAAGPERTSWRFGNFLFPFWTHVPNGEFGHHIQVRGWVPLDDEHTMYCVLWWKHGLSAMTQQAPAFKDGTPICGMGRWRLAANASNDWELDRAAQRDNVIYSGIGSIHLQDQAVTESMGPILDHTFEHLAPSDQMIARTRRRLLAAARALRDRRVPPPGTENVEVFRDARGGYFVSDARSEWRDAYAKQMAAAYRPHTTLHAREEPLLRHHEIPVQDH
jgi:phthalate 4,5-dioxygenase